ncbi:MULTISPECIES: response regulator transcription factor [Marinicauda]|uniref:response regulator transcription factor n=1 Tax=Marinicauda TaxID=1649466 RepID=UPI0022E44AB2|nr:response regulator transcription factor [Marinicauda sp. Alg238-R41]
MAAKRTVLIVDDDADLRDALADQFSYDDEFAVLTADSAKPGIELAQDEQVDIVILDVGLPDMDGREACRILRKNGVTKPVILLTAQSGDADHVLGLRSGASDFIAKPVSFVVLLERLNTHLRRHEQSEDAVLQLGPYQFKPSMKLLLEGDRKVRLTEKETNILKYLYRAGGETIAREELLDKVWGYHREANTHTLETHVYRLRQKIEPEGSKARLLVTESGGYRLQL